MTLSFTDKATSFTDKTTAQATRHGNRHPYWTLVVVFLLLTGAALTFTGFLLSSYITTTRLAPFFDDQLVTDVGGSEAFAQQHWRVDTRVGALEICHTIVSPTQWASPEKCFDYRTDSLVVTRWDSEPQPFPSACGLLRANRTLESTLTNVLDSVCAFPGLLVAALPVLAGLISILTAAVAASSLFVSVDHVRSLHKVSCIGATLSALFVLVTYLIWTTVVAAGLDMRQAISAQLTIAALGAFAVAAAVALALVRVEVEEQETLRPIDAVAA